MNVISAYATVRYARGNALIYGDFYFPPEDAFFAKVFERLPYIDENGNKRFYDNTFYVICGKLLESYDGETYFFSKYKDNHVKEAKGLVVKDVVSVDLMFPWLDIASSKDVVLASREEFNDYLKNYYERFLDILEDYNEVNHRLSLK